MNKNNNNCYILGQNHSSECEVHRTRTPSSILFYCALGVLEYRPEKKKASKWNIIEKSFSHEVILTWRQRIHLIVCPRWTETTMLHLGPRWSYPVPCLSVLPFVSLGLPNAHPDLSWGFEHQIPPFGLLSVTDRNKSKTESLNIFCWNSSSSDLPTLEHGSLSHHCNCSFEWFILTTYFFITPCIHHHFF